MLSLKLTKITDIVDDRAKAGLCAEHGLSLLIEVGEERILFDTGAGAALLPNAGKLGIDLEKVSRIVLSHSHYDHTGGIKGLKPSCPIYVGEGIETPSFSRRQDGTVHPLGMEESSRTVLRASEVRMVSGVELIASGIWLSGPIARKDDLEQVSGFYFDSDCTRACRVLEEQAMLTEDGVLVVGCGHAGIINTIESFRMRAELPRIRSIVGGLHLQHTEEREIKRVADYLNELKIERLILLHCTGDEASEILATQMSGNVERGEAGKVWLLGGTK